MIGPRGTVCVFLVLVLAPFAPAYAVDTPPIPTQGVVLSVGSLDEMKTRNLLSPVAWEDPHTMAVLARIYDTAVQRNATTGAIVPRLAVGIDENGNQVLDPAEIGTFVLASGEVNVTVFYNFGFARFHDGMPVTVMDVLFSYHALALNPYGNVSLRALMDQGGGPGSNHSTDRWLWVLPVDDGDGNASTAALRFTMQYPFVNFLWATLGIPILPRHVWEGTGSGRHADFGLAVYPETDARAGQGIPVWELVYRPFDASSAMAWEPSDANVIGSGHFSFVHFRTGIETLLDANVEYAFGPPKVDGIRFRVFKTMQLLVFAMQAGEIDLIFANIGSEFVPDLSTTPSVEIWEVPGLFPAVLQPSLRRLPWGYSPFPPPNRTADTGYVLRSAIAHLLDKQGMVDALLQGHGSMAHSMVGPSVALWHNASLLIPEYDLAMANAILDSPEAQAAGIGPDPPGLCSKDSPSGCRFLPDIGSASFEILMPQADYDPILASSGALIAQEMQDVGLNAVAKPTWYGELLNRIMNRDFHLFLISRPEAHVFDPWTLARDDPDSLFALSHSSNEAGYNAGGFWDGPFDAIANASRSDMVFAERQIHVREEQGVIAERFAAFPLFFRNWFWAFRTDRLGGWELVGMTVFNYWTLQGLTLAPPPNNPPVVVLLSPSDGAVIRPCVSIDLSVTDSDLVSVAYRLDTGGWQPLAAPYDVDTCAWPDGMHTLDVAASDSGGNQANATFGFVVDSAPPTVLLRSPSGGSVIRAGTIVDFDVQDANLAAVTLDIVVGSAHQITTFPSPYDVDTSDFADATYEFVVNASDSVGYAVEESSTFVIDSTPPTIALVSPANDSLVSGGTVADFRVEDVHLGSVTVSVDEGAPSSLAFPHDFALGALADGAHTFLIRAVDEAANEATGFFALTLDATSPTIVKASPRGSDVALGSPIHVRFSEPVNRTSAEAAFVLSGGGKSWTALDGTFAWASADEFVFALNGELAEGTVYTVRVKETVKDVAGNSMEAPFSASFTTARPSLVIVLMSIPLAFLLAVVLAFLLLLRRRKRRPVQAELDKEQKAL